MKFFFALASAILATGLVSAEPSSKASLIQHTLRGTPITTDPRITPGSGPPPQVRTARKPSDPQIQWPDHSAYGPIFQTVFACTWIAVIASLPFIIPLIDHQPVTKTQKVVGASMLVVLFGGVYLFTNIILFNSVHFKQTRPLTVVECIYFMSQVITTVGYGDIYPAKVRGQVFVGLYVLGALFIIAMLVSDVTNHVASAAQRYRESLLGAQNLRSPNRGKHDKKRASSVHELIAPTKPSMRPLLISLACFAAIDVVWVVFFSLFPGENKTVFQAFYMSVITLSSVGLGAFTPLTEEGMIFGAFFMLFGTAALVSAIGNFCTLVVKMNEFERFTHTSKQRAAEHLRDIVQGRKMVSQMQFFEWSVLNQKLMTEHQLAGVLNAFENLGPTNGVVDLKVVEQSMGVEHMESARGAPSELGRLNSPH